MNSGGFCESISSFFPEKGKGSRLLGYVVAGSEGKKEEGRKGKVDSKFFFPVSRSRFRSTCALLFFFSKCSIICHHQWEGSTKKKWIGQRYLVCSAKRRIAEILSHGLGVSFCRVQKTRLRESSAGATVTRPDLEGFSDKEAVLLFFLFLLEILMGDGDA